MSEIMVSFTMPCPIAGNFYEPIDMEVFTFDPPIEGNTFWVNDYTLAFKPSSKLEAGRSYDARLKLSQLFDVQGELGYFYFNFQARTLDFRLSPGALKPYGDATGWYALEGDLEFSDHISPNRAGEIMVAEQHGKKLPVRWQALHNNQLYRFTVDSILRGETESEVLLKWDGSPAGIDNKGEQQITVPSVMDFDLLNVKVYQLPSQRVKLSFSDHLAANQRLDGLIMFDSDDGLSFRVSGNEVEVFPAGTLQGTVTLTLQPGIRSAAGTIISRKIIREINFSRLKPQVSMVSEGVILPSSQGFELPFKAVGLNAVDIHVIKIYEDNIPQFLQVNRIDNDYQIRRVGRPVLKHTVDLASTGLDMNVWNFFSVDLSSLISPDPGAIYNIEFAFYKGYSAYECQDGIPGGDDGPAGADRNSWDFEETTYWDDPEGYYWGYWPEGYDWREEDNPCHVSYYNSSRFVKTNILASDLGLIVKSGSDGRMLVAVSDLVTSGPVEGVTLEVLNYQLQRIAHGTSGKDGMAEIEIEGSPFLLVAQKGRQKGYLRIDDGSALSVSDFDVSGRTVDKGIKGYIYAERGVWRPGDTIFLNFILDAPHAGLPDEHPLVFELLNPFGKPVQRIVKTGKEGHIYRLTTKTFLDAPTGTYTAKVSIGGVDFSKPLRIETVKPNRLKLHFDPGTGPLQGGQQKSAELSVAWLHGAPAGYLKAKVDMLLYKSNEGFDKFPGYTFTDPSREFYPEEIAIFDGKLDQEGKAQVSFTPPLVSRAPGMLKAAFTVRAFEKGGDISTDFFTMDYAPYRTFVGIKMPEGDKRGMLLTDTSQRVSVITCDAGGRPVSKSNLKAAVYKVTWRWWWNATDDDMASFFSSEYSVPVAEGNVTTDRTGKGTFEFRINYPEWGRYFIRVWDPEGGAAAGKTVYVDWPGWAGQARREFPGAASLLTFTSDKESYITGETATVIFPSSGKGRALITIESGSEVLHASWITDLKEENKYSFAITTGMAPNVYVGISLVQPHAVSGNDAPMRLYGVIPVMVSDPASRIMPVIEMADVLEPEKKVDIRIREESGIPMTYTLAVVDEGLLDLTRFTTPDPWNNFFAREALGVRTWDLYSHVIGAYGGKLEKVFGIGGDDEIAPVKDRKASRFTPVVRVFGPFRLGKGGSAKHTFIMPNYVGSVRTMVVAAGEGAYGSAEKTSPVRKPLMLLATLPRMLGPGEEVTLPLTIFAMEEGIRDIDISVKANGMFREKLLEGQARFDAPGEQVVYFTLETIEDTGLGIVEAEISSGSHKATYRVEVDVRNPNPPVSRLFSTRILPGEAYTFSEMLPGMPGTNSASLEVAGLMPVNLDRRLNYLISYPHGCFEQTISAAFPQLYLSRFSELSDAMEKQSNAHVRKALNDIIKFQANDGGLSLWPGERSNEWVTSYAGQFFLEAAKKGFGLPVGLRSSWLEFQQGRVVDWSWEDDEPYNRGLEQAYRLYTLALAGSADLRAMNRLRETPGICATAKWQLAATYMLAGQPEAGNKIAADAGMLVGPYRPFDLTFGSGLRDKAMILESLCLIGDKDKAFPVAMEISEALAKQEWMSTQTTAMCLMAMSSFYGEQPVTSEGLMFSYAVSDEDMTRVRNDFHYSRIPMETVPGDRFVMKVVNDGDKDLYATLNLEGTPLTDSIGDTDRNISLQVSYRDMEGRMIDPVSILQGTDFIAEVRVNAASSNAVYRNLALTQVFPSGWEIINRRIFDGPDILEESGYDYRDIRDDRVMTYFSLDGREVVRYKVLLNAAYPGRYYMPGPQCEAMYDPAVYARRSGSWVEVRRSR